MSKKSRVKIERELYSLNLPRTRRELAKNTKDYFANQMKPGGSVGIISGIVEMADTIESEDFNEYADASLLNKQAGVCKNKLKKGKVAYADASVFEAKAGVGGIVGGSVSALSASAHAKYGLDNSIGVDATLVKAEANLGPVKAGAGVSLDTSASIGVHGVSASFLGTGFSFGPTVGIKTPFFNFSVSLF